MRMKQCEGSHDDELPTARRIVVSCACSSLIAHVAASFGHQCLSEPSRFHHGSFGSGGGGGVFGGGGRMTGSPSAAAAASSSSRITRAALRQLRADALGGLAPLIDQLIVGAVALELVVERGGVEPGREDLAAAAPSSRRARRGCRARAAALPARVDARDRGTARRRASRRAPRVPGERRAIGRVERAPDRNRQPLVALDQPLILQVAAIRPASGPPRARSNSSACRTCTALRR